MTPTSEDPHAARSGHDEHAGRSGHPGHPPHAGHGPALEHGDGLAELLDLDAAVGAPVLAEALDAAAAALGHGPTAVVDLGAGTGTGTLALARRFPGASVASLDASPAMIKRLAAAASAAQVGDRVHPHLVDLDGDWPAVLPGPVDLAWAALSLHHVADPARVLRQALAALRPGGVLVVTEMTRETAYDPGDLGTGRAGLGERLVAALAARGYPAIGEWSGPLAIAGFAPAERRDTAVTASGSSEDGARYIALQLRRHRAALSGDLTAGDLEALDAAAAALVAGTSRLAQRSGRTVWIAARPPGPAAAPGQDGSGTAG